MKKGGGYRETFDALPPLKTLHDRIQKRILRAIDFPPYLMGGLRDPEHFRGYIRNARLHAGARLLVGEDAESFFPSVPVGRIAAAFRHVCRFPPPVADILAKLCTRRGTLVQGAITSPYLANLALYREEPRLAQQLESQGVTYTRFLDDMNASTVHRLSKTDRTGLVKLLRGTLEKAGLRPKRKKQVIAGSGSRMVVNNLNIAGGRASRDRGYRHNLRAALHQLEMAAKEERFTAEFEKSFISTAARIGGLRELNPNTVEKLRLRLDKIKRARRRHISRAPHPAR